MITQHIDFWHRQMLLRLEDIRGRFTHAGAKGDAAEDTLREFVKEFLPIYFRVGSGQVIDRQGGISRQQDVVILNEHHPYLNDLSKQSVFIIEGVACVAEVKSVLTGKELDRALENSLSFKDLHLPFLPAGATVGGAIEDIERYAIGRPTFLFAFESELSLAAIKARVEAWNAEHSLPLKKQLDAVFVLTTGSMINLGTGNGVLKANYRDGRPVTGYNASPPQVQPPLVALLMWLGIAMPRIDLPRPPLLDYLSPVAPSDSGAPQ